MIASLPRDTRRWNVLTILALGFATLWTFASRVPVAATTGGPPPASPREGFSAPDFTLDLLGGGSVTLSELRGKVVMINLWASWCIPCRVEMPEIERVYQAYQDQGLVVLAVNSTFQDSERDAAAFVQELGLTFPVPLDRTGAVGQRYRLRALPSTFFVDRQGVIRSAVFGTMNAALIQAEVETLIEEAP